MPPPLRIDAHLRDSSLAISPANIWPNRFHQNRTLSWLASIPRSAKRSSTLRSDNRYRTYIITTRRMTSGELLKYRKGLPTVDLATARHAASARFDKAGDDRSSSSDIRFDLAGALLTRCASVSLTTSSDVLTARFSSDLVRGGYGVAAVMSLLRHCRNDATPVKRQQSRAADRPSRSPNPAQISGGFGAGRSAATRSQPGSRFVAKVSASTEGMRLAYGQRVGCARTDRP
jgi:hypothetical protein